MTPPSRSRAQRLLDLAVPFVGVGGGAVTVVLVHNPKALIPPPYTPWLFSIAALSAFAMVLALGLEDGWAEDDEVDHAQRWKALGLAYLAGVIATLTFVATVALIKRLD